MSAPAVMMKPAIISTNVPDKTKSVSVNLSVSRRQKALATTRERGMSLIADGYRVLPIEGEPGRYFVQRPEPKRLRCGTLLVGYTVDLTERDVTCTCDAFREIGDCKHRIGTIIEVARALRLVGPMLPNPFTVRLDALVASITSAPQAVPTVAPEPVGEVIGYELRREDNGALIQTFLLSDDPDALVHAERTCAMWEKRLPSADLAVFPIFAIETRATTAAPTRRNASVDFD